MRRGRISRLSILIGLASVLALGMSLAMQVHAQDTIGDTCDTFVCKPAIWPDKSAAWGNTIRILGWNFSPLTAYDLVVVNPEGYAEFGGTVTMDAEGNMLLNDGDGIGDPFQYVVGNVLGTYEVHVYQSPWSGDPTEVAIASTAFLHNDFGN